MRRIALSLAVCIVSCAAPAAQFHFGSLNLTVPDGFEIELIAAPPLVDRPISLSFDELGRLYATDSAGMAGDAPKMAETKPHRVMRLEDTDGDGKFDKTTVFADKLGFPEGCLWREGALYVSTPPQIWKITDNDKREIWHDGKTVTHCGNDLHGPYLGRDGWIYWCKGAFAEQKYDLFKSKLVTKASHIFRAHLDGTGIEPVLTGGMDNPVGFTVTPDGERFLSCTFFQNPAGGKRDGLIHAIYGGVYGKVQPVIDNHKATGGIMPVLSHMGAAAPCGLACYDSTVFGADYRGNLFTCCFNLHKVVRTVLVPDGATYIAKDTDFLTGDSPDFHPTEVLEDADGSLIVADTGGWYKICCPTSQLAKPDVLGAIYRIRRTGAPKIDDPRGLKIAWDKLPNEDLVELLGDPRLFVRQRAIDVCGKSNPLEIVKWLRSRLENRHEPEFLRNCVWTLARIDNPAAREAVRIALNDADPSVVHAAIHVAGLWRDAKAMDKLSSLLAKEDQSIARAAAEALGHIGDKRAVPALFGAAGRLVSDQFASTGAPENAAQRTIEHSIIYALIEIADSEATRGRMRASSNSRVIRAAMVALDQMDGGDLTAADVLRYLDSPHVPLKNTAAWIVGRHPDWGGDLAGYFRERLEKTDLTFDELGSLTTLIGQQARAAAVQELLASIADSGARPEVRIAMLRAMAASSLKEAPSAWLKALAQIIPVADAAMLSQCVSTARALTLPKSGHAALATALIDIGRNKDKPDELRLNALAAAGKLKEPDAPLFDFLASHLALQYTSPIRSAAARILVSADLSAAQQTALTAALATTGPLELPQLLSAFERNANEELGVKLIEALKNSKGLRGLRADALKALVAKYPKPVQDAAQELLAQLNANAAEQAAHLKELQEKLPAGDVRRGQLVFQSTKAACSTCHAIGYLGGTMGPDLTNIGKSRNERDLLEAVVYPSASFVRSYEPIVVATKGGERFNGILRRETSDEIVLATGAQTEQHVARADIAQLQPSTVSVMPAGMEQVLTPQELSDLITFMKNLK